MIQVSPIFSLSLSFHWNPPVTTANPSSNRDPWSRSKNSGDLKELQSTESDEI
jgi:hypothetical protein